MQPAILVERILGFDLRVRDVDRATRFYCGGLGFSEGALEGGDRCVSLGEVRVRLIATAAGGMPAAPGAADAPDFQHFAIRVGDMAAAFAHLAPFDPQPISRGGPQLLPPADGCVTAWKFRDPDGHPLELLQPALEQGRAPGAELFEAVDHTALACADPAASLAFYARLGFTQGDSSHNRGAPQDRLDGLDGVDLHIATVHTRGAGPHIELLHYVSPPPPPGREPPREAFVLTRLEAQGPAERVADPDGHQLTRGEP